LLPILGFDALVAAATGGSAEACTFLLGKGLSPNVMAGSGGAPLMIAARMGAADAVQVKKIEMKGKQTKITK